MEQSYFWGANIRWDGQVIPLPFMEPEGSLQCSQETATGLCPELESSPDSNPIFCFIFIISFHVFLVISSLQVFRRYKAAPQHAPKLHL
jgi:hypothetical protein